MTDQDPRPYAKRLKELEKWANVPEFYLQDQGSMDELSLEERMLPSAWNAEALFAYATDPQCPNADYFLNRLSEWILSTYLFHKERLQLNPKNQLVPKPGISWGDFFPGLQPMYVDPAGPPVKDLILESSIAFFQKQLTAINETLARLSHSTNTHAMRTYQDTLSNLK